MDIIVAYIDGSGDQQDEWGRSKGALYGYKIVKKGIFLDPLAPIEEVKEKPVVVRSKKRLTSNEAEFSALKILVENVENNCCLKVYSDSKLLVRAFGGKIAGRNVRKVDLKNKNLQVIKEEIENCLLEKNITLFLEWIPREENVFGEVLDRIKFKSARERRKLRKQFKRAGYE